MPNVQSYKVNCADILDSNVVNIYNLGPTLLFAMDIFIYSRVQTSINWILSPNTDGSPKIQFRVDDSQTFDIMTGSEGESFSNPISYSRNTNIGPNIKKIPTHNKDYQTDVSFIGGGMNSSAGSNWSYRFPITNTENDISLQLHNPGLNNDFLKLEILISPSTDFTLLNNYMKDVTITVAPSLFKGLKYSYLDYDSEPETPTAILEGIRY
jgi:hypothetical protein